MLRHRLGRHGPCDDAAAGDRRVLAADGFVVSRSDFWTYDAPRLAAGGSDTRTFGALVPSTTTHLKVTLSHPSLAVANRNQMVFSVTVRDAARRVLGSTTEATSGAGTASLLVDLRSLVPAAAYGTFTFEAIAQRSLSDPDTLDSESLLGRMVTLQVAQLRASRPASQPQTTRPADEAGLVGATSSGLMIMMLRTPRSCLSNPYYRLSEEEPGRLPRPLQQPRP